MSPVAFVGTLTFEPNIFNVPNLEESVAYSILSLKSPLESEPTKHPIFVPSAPSEFEQYLISKSSETNISVESDGIPPFSPENFPNPS